MLGKKGTQGDTLPESFTTLEDFWEFWDTHSSADYEDAMETVKVEIDLSSRTTYCAIAQDLLAQVRTQARQQGVSTETLVNLWLREKIAEPT
jgi:hypothetical protein